MANCGRAFPNDGEDNRSRNRRVEISFVTEQSRTERIQVGGDGPVTEIRQVEVPVEAAMDPTGAAQSGSTQARG